LQVFTKARPLARRLPIALLSAVTLVLAGGASSGAATTTVVTLTFDNNTISEYTLGYSQALQPHGVAATFYVNSGTIGASKNFISWTQLATLAAAGNEIGGKTVDGKVNLKTNPDLQTKIDEVCNDRQALIQHGFSPTSFAYPFAAFDTTAEGIVRNCGYGNARAGGGISPTGALYAETRPPKDYFATRPYGPSQVTLANLEAVVTGAAAHGGGWDQVVIQKVCSQAQDPSNYSTCTASSGWIELADLNSFLDWIQAAGQANGAPAGTTIQTTAATMQSMDTVAPITAISCNGSPCASTAYNGTVMVTMAPTDAGSGVASTHYTLDGTDPTLSSPTYTGRLPLTSSTTVMFRSWDNAGNVEATNTQSIQLIESSDSTAPITTISCNGSPCAPSYTTPVTVTLNAADNAGGWGVDKTYYTTDGSTPTTSSPVYTGSFAIHGPMTVNFFSTDLAGNTEAGNSQSIQITTVVTLGFDDAYQNHWRYVVPLLRSHDMNATFYVITSDSDGPFPCCMSWAQLNTLQSQGDDIGSHTINHPDLTTLTPAQITQEVCGSRQDMIAHGIHDPVSFAYPFGTHNATAENIVQQCGFTNARVGGGVSTSNFTPTAPYIETLPAKDPMAVRTIAVDGASPMTLADLKAFVNAASAHGGGWLPMTFHNVCDQAASDYSSCMSSYGPIDDVVLGQFLDWLGAAGQPTGAPAGVAVKTMAQIMPGGTPPPAPAITDQPPLVSGSNTATFSFTDGQPGVTFQCTVDGASSTCSSPFSTGVLADGSHTFTVWALDSAGNVSSGTSYSWTVDTTPPPAPTLTSTPPANDTSTSASFSFGDDEAAVSFECQLDAGSFSTCTSPATYAGLTDGSHTFAVRARDAAGTPSTVTSYTWSVQGLRPPAPTIDSKPANPSNTSTATFAFSDSDGTVSFQCSVDGAAYSPCPSLFTTAALTDGSHTFAVEAVDITARTSDPTQYTWTIDTTPPPAPTLTSTPPANDTSTSASFSFSDDEAAVSFECQLDGGSFATCTSPATFSGLADGSHTFAVRARDAAANPSTVTSYTWSLQGQRPPAPSIGSKPANPSNASTSTFAFSDTDGTVSFQCSVDGAAYSACTSPLTTAALTDGSHTFAVEAVDASNRTSDPTQYTWTIDTVAPPAPSITSKPAASVASGNASFGFSDTQAGVAFECQLDAAAFASCTSPAAYSGLATGQHTFAVRARDAAGNASTATSYSWRIDVTPPAQPTGLTTSITSQAVNLTWNANTETDLAGYNVYRSSSATGPFTKLNSALLTARSYQDTTAPAVTTSFYQLQAVDQLGNASTPAQLSVKRGIALRGATGATVTSGTSITLNKPSGTASGDVLIAAIEISGTTTVTAPSGWVLIRSTTSGSALTQASYVHTAGASEPSSYQWQFSSSRLASATVAAYVGVNGTTPVDVSSGGSSSGSTSIIAPSLTTTTTGDLLIGAFGGAANASVTPATGMLEENEQLAGTGNSRLVIELCDQQLGAAGATGTRTATLSKSGANVGQLIALRPSQ
jgi:peptidoglycan/xylan/chitin deacetylase (PgdA/CDA1 family)